MNRTPSERKRRLWMSGHTIQALANEAGVSWRMAKYWVEDQKTSANVAAAYERLTTPTRRRNGAA